MDFLYGLFTGQKEGEECIKSSDIEVVMTPAQKAASKEGSSQDGSYRWRDSQGPGDGKTHRRPSQGPGDGRNPRRPSQGPGEEQAVSQSSKSIDFSKFQKTVLLSGAKLVPRPDSHTETKKITSKLGKHIPSGPLDSCQEVLPCLRGMTPGGMWNSYLDMQKCDEEGTPLPGSVLCDCGP